jgi:hypothetical protein
MKNLLNKNLILIFAVLALVLSFSLANKVSARTVTVDFGASSEFDQNDNNNNNSGNNNNGNNNNNNNNQNSSLVPVITSISPTSGITKTGAKTLTINGYNFIPSSVARWNGSDRSTSYVSSSQLLMRTTDADISGLGAYSITVYNHTSNGGVSNTAYYTLNKAPASSSTTSKPKPSSTAKPKPASTTPACATEATTDKGDNSNLTASALFSSDTFLPTSFLGWLLLLIFILLIVIVWRKLNRSTEKYKATPLKHA